METVFSPDSGRLAEAAEPGVAWVDGLHLPRLPGAIASLLLVLLAAVSVAPSPAAAETEGDLRLVGGIDTDSPRTGRLEIFHTQSGDPGRWGPICDDAFRIHEARVACKQLGYGDAKRAIKRYSVTHSMTDADFWLDDLDCNGTESKLTDCRRRTQDGREYVTGLQWGQHNCVPQEQVGVECTADTTSNSIQIDKRKLVVAEGLSAPFTVRLGKAPSDDVTVTMAVTDGPDLTLDDSSLTFTTSNWDDPQTVTVTAASDTDTTDDTGITIGFSSTGGGYQGARSPTLKVEIRDDDVKGITIAPTRLNSYETDLISMARGGTVRRYRVEMTGAPSEDVTINLVVAGNSPGGVGATDITLDPSSLTFKPTDWSGPRTVTPKVTKDADSISETVTISHTIVTEDSDYSAMNLPDVTMRVKDVGGYGPGLSVNDVTATEGRGVKLDFKVTLFPSSTDTVMVRYKTVEGTATVGEDYFFRSGQLVFAPGETEKTVRVRVIDDSVEDSGNTVWFQLTIATGATLDDQWGLGTILNSETSGHNTAPAGSPTISGTPRAGETLTASSTGITDSDGLANATFAWQWMAIDGTDRSDIADATSESYTLTSAEAGKTIQVRATFTDDGGTEETLVSAASETVAASSQQQVVSDTDPPTVTVTSDATGPVTGDFNVTVTFSEAVTGFEKSEITIANGTASSMTGNEAGDEYTVAVTPDPGASGTLSVEVPAGVASDAAANANTASGAFGIAVRTALTASFSSVSPEHDGSANFTVQIDFSEAPKAGIRRIKESLEVTGATVARVHRVTRRDNSQWTVTLKPSGNGTVQVSLAPATEACDVFPAICTSDGHKLTGTLSATIPGPASTPLVSIAASSSPVTEGAAASFALSRRGGPAVELTVDVSVSEEGAMVDGTALLSTTFAAGSATATLTVATEDDEVAEAASVITATVSSGAGYALDSGAASASVTVEDDDTAPAFAVVGPLEVDENVTAIATLAATDEDTAASDLAWSLVGGADADMVTLSTAGVLAFKAAKDFEAPDDADQDGAYEVTVRVTDGANPVDAALTVQLADVDEIAPVLSGANVDGDVLTLTFDEALDTSAGPASGTFAVDVDDSARGVSAVSLDGSSVTLTLASAVLAGETVTVSYTVPTGAGASPLKDAAGNPVASFSGESMTNATTAVNAAPTGLPAITGTARIGETLTASESGIADADGLTNASFAWQWVAHDGTTDTDLADATGTTYTLTAAEAGKTIKVRVTFTDDAGTEETLVSAATAEVGAAAAFQVSIAASSTPVTEGTAASFTLSRTGDATEALTVAVSVREAGSVLSGTPASTVTFAAGNAEATLSVATENDAVDEADATVTVSVSAGSGYTVDPAASSAGVAVHDNDAAAAGEATVTTLWSATLEWTDMNGDWLIANAEDFTNAGWSEDGTDYNVWYFAYGPYDGELWLRLKSGLPAGGIPDAEELTLHVGGATVATGDALSAFAGRDIGIADGVWQDWEEGDRVSVRLTRTVASEDATASLPGISVADAEVREAEGAALSFRVMLGAAQTAAVSVRYATSDGTAVAGQDYKAVSGVLRFEPGQTSKTVSAPVINDEHDDDGETMTLTLSSPFGATISDGTATGTIRNTGPMPQAWIARFGRMVADQVLEAVESRMTAPRVPGTEVSLAGRQVGGVAADVGAQAAAQRNLAEWFRDGDDPERGHGLGSQTMTQRDFLLGSSFSFTGGTERTGTYALWGRGALTRFDGREGELSLNGEVTSGMLGADWSRDRIMAGLVVSQSLGEGSYGGEGGNGAVSSSLTGFYPWGRHALSERFSVWGVAGYGEGTLTLTPEGGAPIRTDLDLLMAAAGLRGVLVEAPEAGGFELAVKTDALGVRTGTAKAEGLGEAEAEVTRLRLGLEASRPFRFAGGAHLTPSMEIGVRHDGGDAETGFGVDMGGGLSWSDPQRGLSAEIRGRGLLTHDADGFLERGFSGSLSWDPTPETARGLKLTLSQTVGVQASGGMDALLERAPLAGLAANDDGESEWGQPRFETRLGYGRPAFGNRLTAIPEMGFGFSGEQRDYSLGWRLTREARFGGSLGLSLEARRQESANEDVPPEHGIGVRVTARW